MITQKYQHQYSNKLSKGTSHTLPKALVKTALKNSFTHTYQQYTNRKRLIIEATWSNLQRAIDTLQVLPLLYKGKLHQGAIDRLIQELQEAQEEAVLIPKDLIDSNNWRTDFTPQEYTEQVQAFQFVLDQFGFDYDYRAIPHFFRYKQGTRGYCHYKRTSGLDNNGGPYYFIDIDPTGSRMNSRWYTYGRTSLGWKAEGIKTTPKIFRNIVLVHEATHAIENYRSQRTHKKYTSSEMNTTLMELRWVKKNHPELFRKLTPVQDGRRSKWWSPVEPLPGMNPERMFQESKKAAAPTGQ